MCHVYVRKSLLLFLFFPLKNLKIIYLLPNVNFFILCRKPLQGRAIQTHPYKINPDFIDCTFGSSPTRINVYICSKPHNNVALSSRTFHAPGFISSSQHS